MAKIPRGIVITTSEHTKDFLPGCLESLRGLPIAIVSNGGFDPYPIITKFLDGSKDWQDIRYTVNDRNGFELGGIEKGAGLFDEFIHLMDTCVVTNQKMLNIMFEHPGSMYLCDGFFSYLGKYRTEILEQIGIPKIDNKADAVALENVWNRRYLNADPHALQFSPPLPVHTDVFEDKFGRKNMVLDNGYIIKYKGTWSL